MKSGNSLAVWWLGLCIFTTMAWVQSLVRELRSPKSCGTAKKKKSGVLSRQGVSKEADWPVEILHVKVCAAAWLQQGFCYLPQPPGLQHGSSSSSTPSVTNSGLVNPFHSCLPGVPSPHPVSELLQPFPGWPPWLGYTGFSELWFI